MEAMSDLQRSDLLARWHGRALCCRYVGVFLRSLPMRVLRHGSETILELRWALSWHAEGGPEVVGTWLPDGIADLSPTSLIARMHEKGIERIGVLIGDDLTELAICGAWVARPQPGASLRPVEVATSVERCSARSSERRRLVAADQYVRDLERRLKAALARREVFYNDALAMAFIVEYLKREERKVDKLVRLPEFRPDLTLDTRRTAQPRSAPARVRAAPQLR